MTKLSSSMKVKYSIFLNSMNLLGSLLVMVWSIVILMTFDLTNAGYFYYCFVLFISSLYYIYHEVRRV